MNNLIKKYILFVNRFELCLSTLVTWIRFGGCISAKGKVWFEKNVQFVPFEINQSLLKVIFSGKNRIGMGTAFQGAGLMIWGENSYCGRYCVFGVNEKIEIGKNVMIADVVSIRDTDHVFDDLSLPSFLQGIKTAPVVIEEDVWIGHGATLLKGIRIGKGAVIGAGAVVTKDVEAYMIVAGVPAKALRSRKP